MQPKRDCGRLDQSGFDQCSKLYPAPRLALAHHHRYWQRPRAYGTAQICPDKWTMCMRTVCLSLSGHRNWSRYQPVLKQLMGPAAAHDDSFTTSIPTQGMSSMQVIYTLVTDVKSYLLPHPILPRKLPYSCPIFGSREQIRSRSSATLQACNLSLYS